MNQMSSGFIYYIFYEFSSDVRYTKNIRLRVKKHVEIKEKQIQKQQQLKNGVSSLTNDTVIKIFIRFSQTF